MTTFKQQVRRCTKRTASFHPFQSQLAMYLHYSASCILRTSRVLTISLQKISFGSKPPVSTESFEVARSKQPDVFDAYYTTQLSSVYSHYEDEVNKKRKLRAPPVRAYGTRHAAAEEALNDLESESVPNKRRRSAGDDQGDVFHGRSPVQNSCSRTECTISNLLQGIGI